MCLLFPNSLYHQVYPFQGSGERRSIAFNMAFKGFSKSSGIQLAGDSVNLYNETNLIEQGRNYTMACNRTRISQIMYELKEYLNAINSSKENLWMVKMRCGKRNILHSYCK